MTWQAVAFSLETGNYIQTVHSRERACSCFAFNPLLRGWGMPRSQYFGLLVALLNSISIHRKRWLGFLRVWDTGILNEDSLTITTPWIKQQQFGISWLKCILILLNTFSKINTIGDLFLLYLILSESFIHSTGHVNQSKIFEIDACRINYFRLFHWHSNWRLRYIM